MFKNGWLFAISLGLSCIIMVYLLGDRNDEQKVQIKSLQESAQLYEQTVESLKDEIEALTYRQLPVTGVTKQLPGSVEQCFRVGEWDYIVMTFNPGTRSEGFNSILAVNGNAVEPNDLTNKTATVETPWGTMRWLGHIDDRKHAWEGSGWRLEEGE